uniref:Methyltransferase-like protein 13 n=1 Tax=Tanacetum cinerariifolium TaxID=118510 RepID=A0A699H1N0_TANCI|nr:methyltransferase-like protein 13 [Tanacetum cinerariifolium]
MEELQREKVVREKYEKSLSEILKIKKELAESKKNLQFTIKSTDKVALEEYDLKSSLYQSMHANKSFNKNPANHQLYHALIEAVIKDENAMDKGVADTVKDHKRKHDDDEDDDDEDPLVGPNQGKKTKMRRTKEFESSKKPSFTKETAQSKVPTKGSKTGKSASAKEPVEEPIAEVLMDDAGDNLPWFNQMVSALTDPLTFNNLMATPIDFSKYVLNGLKIENLTQDILLGPAFNMLKEYLETSNPKVSKFSKQNVYSNKSILGVKIVSVKKLHGYGYLKEIVVKRSDQQLYKFKEGDFVDLHLNDIEDMLLFAVQHKLFHLDGSDIVDFIVALRLFTRSLILKRHVEDLQLGVERLKVMNGSSLQKKVFLDSSHTGTSRFMAASDGIMERKVVHQVTSELTGQIVVDDVVYENINGELSHLFPSKDFVD